MRLQAEGSLKNGWVTVSDEAAANRLHGKAALGVMQSGGALRLSAVEAAWGIDAGRLSVVADGGPVAAEALLAGEADGAPLEVAFLAYRDLRERGLVVRPAGPGLYHVWDRGQGPPREIWFGMRPVAERDAVRVHELAAWASEGSILSVVDEDGAVTHYRASLHAPIGSHASPDDLPPSKGIVLQDRVLVTGKAAAAYHRAGLGTPVGERMVLSFTEAAHLAKQGVLQLPPDFQARAAARQHHFTRTFPVCEDLRARGVLPRSGFRFGTHLRAYDADPDSSHAPWLIQCAFPQDVLHWSEISRAVRLAHGVRKSFLLAVSDGSVRYVGLEWFRP
jgi:tRNA-intron endonuclease, archaea type